jgi:hypothetical protein
MLACVPDHFVLSKGLSRCDPGRESKSVMHRQLGDSRIGRAGNLAEIAGAKCGVYIPEIRVVENIEQVGAKLNPMPFGDPKVLEKGHVKVDEPRPFDNTALSENPTDGPF